MNLRIGRVPVVIKPTFFLVAALLGAQRLPYLAGFSIWIAVVTISILWHEFGHVFAFRAFGTDSHIELWSFGGLAHPHAREGPVSHGANLIVALAGPMAGFLLGSVVYLISTSLSVTSPILRLFIEDLLFVNVSWGLVNLLPILPLDGGRAAESTLRLIFRGKEGKAANVISLLVAAAGLVVSFTRQEYWIGFMAMWFGGYNAAILAENRSPTTVDGSQPLPVRQHSTFQETTARHLEGGDLGRASRLAERQLSELTDSPERRWAAVYLTWLRLIQGRVADAATIADHYLSGRLMIPAAPEQIVKTAGGPESVIDYLEKAFHETRVPAVKVLWLQSLIDFDRLEHFESLLFETEPILDPGGQIALHISLAQAGRWEVAARVGERLWAEQQDSTVAYNTACSFSRLDRSIDALVWLKRAIDGGFENAELLDSDPDLDSVRERPAFKTLRSEIGA